MKQIEEFLKSRNITPTPVRLLVYKCLRDSSVPLALSDIEDVLGSVDKSTISRTLSIFVNRDLIHSFNDGSGKKKYELCGSHDEIDDNERHVHFRCEKCGETFCMNSVKVPKVELPEGYVIREVNFVITGVCPECS